MGPSSNFVIELGRQRARYWATFLVYTAPFRHNKLESHRQTTDRRHLMTIAELAMQLQRSAKNLEAIDKFQCAISRTVEDTLTMISMISSRNVVVHV